VGESGWGTGERIGGDGQRTLMPYKTRCLRGVGRQRREWRGKFFYRSIGIVWTEWFEETEWGGRLWWRGERAVKGFIAREIF
jgi:hypothetical protein